MPVGAFNPPRANGESVFQGVGAVKLSGPVLDALNEGSDGSLRFRDGFGFPPFLKPLTEGGELPFFGQSLDSSEVSRLVMMDRCPVASVKSLTFTGTLIPGLP